MRDDRYRPFEDEGRRASREYDETRARDRQFDRYRASDAEGAFERERPRDPELERDETRRRERYVSEAADFVRRERFQGREEDFRGVGPAGYRRSDQRIYADGNDRLTDHPAIDARRIEVEVHECEVTLRRTVRARDQKRLAEDVADAASGVRDVHNELRVGEPATSEPAGEGRVRENLSFREAEARTTPGLTLRDPEPRPAEREGFREEPRLYPGMKVVDADGDRLGEVKELRDDVFHLDRPMRRDLFVPLRAITNVIGNEVQLPYHADEIDKLGWESPEILGFGRRHR